MKWLGVLAFLLVAAQGVLGGLRVTMHMDSLGIFHGVLAQFFFRFDVRPRAVHEPLVDGTPNSSSASFRDVRRRSTCRSGDRRSVARTCFY